MPEKERPSQQEAPAPQGWNPRDRPADEDKDRTIPTFSPLAITKPEVLARLTMDQLVEILMATSAEIRRRHSDPSGSMHDTGIVSAVTATISFGDEADLLPEQFLPLPVSATPLDPEGSAWRIALISSDRRRPPLGLTVLGDVVVGRKVQGVNPDLDLSDYDEGRAGISRIHALIRPTMEGLLLSDLGSTNGTFVDGDKLVTGRAVVLHDGATIAFGKCNFKLRIVEHPGRKEA